MARVEREIVVMAPADTVYQVWHNFENFPGFMDNIEEVTPRGENLYHWRAKGPLGIDAEWDAEIVRDEPGRIIEWRSVDTPESRVQTEGMVRFEQAGSGDATRMYLALEYRAPGGGAGEALAKLLANPDAQIDEDLARFKEGMERGGVFRRSTRVIGHGDGEEAPSQTRGTRPQAGFADETPRGPGMSGEQGGGGGRPQRPPHAMADIPRRNVSPPGSPPPDSNVPLDGEIPEDTDVPPDNDDRPTTTSTPGGTLGAPTEADIKRDQENISDRTDVRPPRET